MLQQAIHFNGITCDRITISRLTNSFETNQAFTPNASIYDAMIVPCIDSWFANFSQPSRKYLVWHIRMKIPPFCGGQKMG